jgi:putative phosphoribosyl transferase
MKLPYPDRATAGRELAERLATMHFDAPPVVLALPRGGVPIALEVAKRLQAPLDLLLVRKIGTPGQPELALAAVAEGDPFELVMDDEVQRYVGADSAYLAQARAEAEQEIRRRRGVYLAGRSPVPLAGRTAILVDDGIATGTSVRAALIALRRRQPARLVLAVPVAPADTVAALSTEADEVVCLHQPSPFRAVGLHYVDFHQVSDDEVVQMMRDAAETARRTE